MINKVEHTSKNKVVIYIYNPPPTKIQMNKFWKIYFLKFLKKRTLRTRSSNKMFRHIEDQDISVTSQEKSLSYLDWFRSTGWSKLPPKLIFCDKIDFDYIKKRYFGKVMRNGFQGRDRGFGCSAILLWLRYPMILWKESLSYLVWFRRYINMKSW